MITSSVPKEYAKALFLLGRRTDSLDRLGEELGAFNSLVEKDRAVKNFLLAPKLSADTKIEVLKKALRGRVSSEFEKFMLVLLRKRRQDFLPSICESYLNDLNQHYNRLEVTVATAVGLTAKEIEGIASRLSGRLKRKIIVRPSVDSSLLGGLVCRIGDVVYDGSLRRRMERLAEQLLKAKI